MSQARTISMVLLMIGMALLVALATVAMRLAQVLLLGLLQVAAQAADPQVLNEAMRQADPAAQVQVIRDLGELGPDAEPYLMLLKERFEVGELEVQAAALEALKKIDPEGWGHLP